MPSSNSSTPFRPLKIVAYGSLTVLIAMMMAGTVIEKLHGPEAAAHAIYHHPVFFALWAVTAVAGLVWLLQRLGTRRPFTLLLHAALVLILAGALVTHLSGLSGSVHLREGVPTDTLELEDGSSVELPFLMELKEFRIEYDPGTTHVADYVSELIFLPRGDSGSAAGMTKNTAAGMTGNFSSFAGLTGESPVTISMNHIAKRDGYRFYQADYDEDGRGSILAVSRDPWGVGITYAAYLLLLLAMVGYFFEKDSYRQELLGTLRRGQAPTRGRKRWTLALSAAGAAILVVWFLGAFPKGPLLPVLRSPLLFLHMIPIMVSYALFALTTILGIVGVLLPAEKSARLMSVSWLILLPAVFLLAFGTFLGGVWANISWGNYWAWDPKETWALVTLLVYSFALHGTATGFLRTPKAFHAFCIVAFLCVLVTYFGVNLLLGGMHSYA